MKRKAFTLIELLVVIAIIAILAAILFPVFAQAKTAAKKVNHLSNIKQSATSLALYEGDADDTLPQAPCNPNPPFNMTCDALSMRTTWRFRVQPYMKNKDLFVPPGDTYPGSFNPATVYWFAQTFPDEANAGIKPGMAASHTWSNVDYYGKQGLSITQVSRPATILLLMPSRFEFADLGPWTHGYFFQDPANPSGWAYPGKGAVQAYNRQVNYAYMDGHAKSMNPCSTFGALNWNPGQEPTDDFVWEWFSALPSNGAPQDVELLRRWQRECRTVPEYR